jgi:hypothetical protein
VQGALTYFLPSRGRAQKASNFLIEHDTAVAAEIGRFVVNIFDAPAVMHDAGLVGTVLEIKGMSEFMQGFLDHPVHKDLPGPFSRKTVL